jgi:hypothetical protein
MSGYDRKRRSHHEKPDADATSQFIDKQAAGEVRNDKRD